MLKKYSKLLNKRNRLSLYIGVLLSLFLFIFFTYLSKYTSTNDYCESCHVHPHVFPSWKLSTHYDNKSGIIVNCVDCHLPPEDFEYTYAKLTTGLRDLYGQYFKDSSEFNWMEKSQLEFAVNHVYKTSCIKCHSNLFPRQLSQKGGDAHVYYDQNKDKLRCINCHLHVGHYIENVPDEKINMTDPKIYTHSTNVDSFVNFIEKIPGSTICFSMIAVPEGEFIIGSPEDEEYREKDEGPQRKIKLKKFWIGEVEVTWNEYLLFMKETGKSKGDTKYSRSVDDEKVDGITGPTPPYGNPDQGWGRGDRPAITMTYYGAQVYCEWLSEKTGKNYRLPTEAEWEYACRAGSNGPYFFSGRPSDYSEINFWNSIFSADTAIISSFAVYKLNSGSQTHIPQLVKSNPWGIKHMLGNVMEFCSDFYSENTYLEYSDGVINPVGPATGEERVIRGGSYKSDAADLRIANREKTNHSAWLVTDPQLPKSKWWYSDNKEIGFRIVCEYQK